MTDRGLAQVQTAGSPRQAAFGMNGLQHYQQVQVQASDIHKVNNLV
jgi:hypothetical protein